eukprot:evm.model.scf_501.2 EVM.evm.TU.scf_501.2   scf_501:9997-17031(+)
MFLKFLKCSGTPGVDSFFATVSYRYGHSEVMDIIPRIDDEGHEVPAGHLLLYESFFQPTKGLAAGIEPLLRGLAFSQQAAGVPHFPNALQTYLFGAPMHGGTDLFARNIQRGRDHGIPDYNSARQHMGLERKTSFEDITTEIYLQRILEETYGDVDSIDAYIGGLAEDAYLDSNIGELFYVSMLDQYVRIRNGDRFYFENSRNGLFTEEEINTIRATGLRDVILRNTMIKVMPENVYVQDVSQPWPRQTTSEPEAPGETPSSGSPAAPSAVPSKELKEGVYTLEWSKEEIGGEDYLTFDLNVKAEGWVGIGIAKDFSSKMVGADIIVASVSSSGQITLDDYYSETFSEPQRDASLGGTNDVELLSASRSGGFTNVEFRRKVSTGDQFDRAIKTSGETDIIFAWHSSEGSLRYHGASSRNRAAVDFMAPFSAPPASDPVSSSTGGEILVDVVSGYKLSWRVVSASAGDMIHFTLSMTDSSGSGNGFLALGMEGPDKGFSQADVIVAHSANGQCTVRDYWSQAPDDLRLDTFLGGTDDVMDASCAVSGGKIVATFKRAAAPVDPMDRPVASGGFTDSVLAWGSTPVVDFVAEKTSRLQINYYAAVGAAPSSVYKISPSLPGGVEETPAAPDAPAETDSPPADGEEAADGEDEGEEGGSAITGEATLNEDQGFVLSWELMGEEITFTLEMDGEGFMGIGVPGADKNMHQADIILAVADGGSCEVGDYWSETFAQPSLDGDVGGEDSLTATACEIAGGHMKATFTRSLLGTDDSDRDIPSQGFSVIYAFHEAAGGLQYHGTRR